MFGPAGIHFVSVLFDDNELASSPLTTAVKAGEPVFSSSVVTGRGIEDLKFDATNSFAVRLRDGRFNDVITPSLTTDMIAVEIVIAGEARETAVVEVEITADESRTNSFEVAYQVIGTVTASTSILISVESADGTHLKYSDADGQLQDAAGIHVYSNAFSSCFAKNTFLNPDGYCSECPKEVDCSDSGSETIQDNGIIEYRVDTLLLRPNYWRTDSNSLVFEKCTNSEACIGGSGPNYCSEGYSGPLCEICAPEFAKGLLNRCFRCEGSGAEARNRLVWRVVTGLTTVSFAVWGYLLSKKFKELDERRKSRVKTFLKVSRAREMQPRGERGR
jgi:hypothetical protein